MHIVKVIAIASSLGLLFSMSSWSLFQTTSQATSYSSMQPQKKALDAYKMQKALEFLNQNAPDIDLTTDIGQKRLELLIDQYSDKDSPEELILLYEAFPSSFDYKENASLTIANAFLTTQQTHRYRTIRENWKGHEREPEQWFFMDAEALILDKHFQEASDFLASRNFKGEAETDRLIRLALLSIVEDPKLSWKYLSEASVKDPKNPSLSTFKAYLLEDASKNDMALVEYIYAIQKDPENPLLREHLADFYFRTHQYDEAIQVLKDSLAAPSSDAIWLKALFLNRIITPIKYNWDKEQVPQGELTALVENIKELPPGIFWNNATFDRLPQGQSYLHNQQETYWLRLLMALKNNKESDALDLLQQNPFQTVSWMPELENHLKTIIVYRQAFTSSTSESTDPTKFFADTKSIDKQGFLDTLTLISKLPLDHIPSVDIPKNLHELILSKEVFATLFLAAEWDEAALQLHNLAIIPDTLPEWITIRLIEAIRRNRGSVQALQFAQNQKISPEITWLISQLTKKETSEAKALQARQAFADKDWKRAKELTEALIKQYPDNATLKDNLHNILLEEQKENLTRKSLPLMSVKSYQKN